MEQMGIDRRAAAPGLTPEPDSYHDLFTFVVENIAALDADVLERRE
jgi:hypothetical protein